jgi:hypothetical protein
MPTLPIREVHPQTAAVFLPKSASLPANDNRLPEPEPASPRKVAPKFDTYQGPDTALAHEEARRRQKAAREDAFVEYERRANEIAKAAAMWQDLSLPYDLSDPCDPIKMPEELLALYPNFEETYRLPAATDPLELSDDVLFAWIRATAQERQLHKDWPEDKARSYLDRVHKGPREYTRRYNGGKS